MLIRRYTPRAVLLGLLVTAAGLLFWLWPEKPAQAIGANQNDKIVMAAGIMDDGECVFVLDTITANLWALRMHPKTGKYNASFFRNISKDFDLGEKTKGTPQFTMVTAGERFQRFSAATPIPCVLHVTEATSGRMVAYTLMWNSSARNNVFDPKKPGPITLLDAMQLRGDIVRPVTE
jgi:hypothetical protein